MITYKLKAGQLFMAKQLPHLANQEKLFVACYDIHLLKASGQALELCLCLA